MSTVNRLLPLAFSTSNVVVVLSLCGFTLKLSSPTDIQVDVPSPSSIWEAVPETPFVSSATFNKLFYVFAGLLPAKLPIIYPFYL